MSCFPGRFLKLCGGEPALWHPDHSDDLLVATERIAAALDWPGFHAEKVKPLFDQFRELYEQDVRSQGKGTKLMWLKAMDTYLGPFVRGETTECSSNVHKDEQSVNNIEIDENAPCDICRSPISEDGNEMIFCDSCNMCVHQACYGVIRIPKGDWLCRPCEVNIVNPSCVLCPNKGGAMKYTSDGQNWAHVSCSLWIKEVKIGNPELVEPIIISRIPVIRRNLVCSLCKRKTGACIQCVVKHCCIAFHVTCAFDKGLKMEYKDFDADVIKLLSYCRKHSETKDIPNCKKLKLKKKDIRGRDSLSSPQRFRPSLQRKSSNESVALDDSDSESLETDSSSESSNQSFESNSFLTTESESEVSDESFESDSSSSTQDSMTAKSQIKRKGLDACSTSELRHISKSKEQHSREEDSVQTRKPKEPIHRKSSGETFLREEESVQTRKRPEPIHRKLSAETFSKEEESVQTRKRPEPIHRKLSAETFSKEEESVQTRKRPEPIHTKLSAETFSKEEESVQTRKRPEPIHRKLSAKTFSREEESVQTRKRPKPIHRKLSAKTFSREEESVKTRKPKETINRKLSAGTFSREEGSLQTRKRPEPIHRKLSAETFSSKIISTENISERLNGNFRSKHSDTKPLETGIFSNEQIEVKIPSKDSSPEVLYGRFIKSDHTDSIVKQEEEVEQLSKENEITHSRTRPELINHKVSRATISNNLIGVENVDEEIKSNFRNQLPDAKLLNNRIRTEEQIFRVKEKSPFNDISPKIQYCNSDKGGHTSTPIIYKKNREKIALSNLNPATAAEEASRCKGELPTPIDDARKIAEINHQASCSYDVPSTSQQKTQESFFTQPCEEINRFISREYHSSSDEDEYQHLVASIGKTQSLLRQLTKQKKRYKTKRKRIDSTTNSEDSSDASSADRKLSKRIRMESTRTNICQSPSSERNEHYIQFAKVISSVLKSIPSQIAATLENKIMTMCLENHRQWQQIKSKNR